MTLILMNNSYSARLIGCLWEGLVLAAGTVFNQVVLWKVSGQMDEKGRVQVMHRLCGHQVCASLHLKYRVHELLSLHILSACSVRACSLLQGVIFSIVYHAGRRQICSVSDDRSIRIWQHADPTARSAFGEHEVFDWENAVFLPLHVLYGHSARVWDVKLLNDCIVSIGEVYSMLHFFPSNSFITVNNTMQYSSKFHHFLVRMPPHAFGATKVKSSRSSKVTR